MSLFIKLPKCLSDDNSQRVINCLTKNGGSARFVGGAVRDAIVGIESNDVDIATTLYPQKVQEALTKEGIKVIPVGIEHGTVKAIIDDKVIEITTLRKDIECDGRHAVVTFTDNWAEDAARRDFTINALYCDSDGQIYDYYNGVEDLKNGIVRFIGSAVLRIEEDTLRILRYYRFLSRFSKKGQLDPEAIQACRVYAVRLQDLSGERIQSEMFKLLSLDNPINALSIMHRDSVLKYIDLNIASIDNLSNLIEIEKKYNIEPNHIMRLAILLRNSNEDKRVGALKLAANWRLSNKDGVFLRGLVSPKMFIDANIEGLEKKRTIRKMGQELFISQLYINMAMEKDLPNELIEKYDNLLNFAQNWVCPEFPLSGYDVQRIGVLHGKMIGDALRCSERWWEENDYKPQRLHLVRWLERKLATSA